MRSRNLTERLARASARRRWLVLGAWVLAVLASAAAIAGLLGSALTTEDDFTGSPEAERAEQVLERAFPPVRADRGLRGRRGGDRVVAAADRGRPALRAAAARRSPPTCAAAGAGEVRAGPVSRDRHSALLLVELGRGRRSRSSSASSRRTGDDGFRDADRRRGVDRRGLQPRRRRGPRARRDVRARARADRADRRLRRRRRRDRADRRGDRRASSSRWPSWPAIGQAFVLNFIVVNVLVMMGLAVGIDYSLFVVSRFREERRAGREVDDAVAVAGATASRAVLFSGATVVLALVGMFLVPQTIFRSIAVGRDRRRAGVGARRADAAAGGARRPRRPHRAPARAAARAPRGRRLWSRDRRRRAAPPGARAWRRASRCSSRWRSRTPGSRPATAGVGDAARSPSRPGPRTTRSRRRSGRRAPPTAEVVVQGERTPELRAAVARPARRPWRATPPTARRASTVARGGA